MEELTEVFWIIWKFL